jgi:hypothetical protein
MINPPYRNETTNTTYILNTNRLNFFDAEQVCNDNGGHLATYRWGGGGGGGGGYSVGGSCRRRWGKQAACGGSCGPPEFCWMAAGTVQPGARAGPRFINLFGHVPRPAVAMQATASHLTCAAFPLPCCCRRSREEQMEAESAFARMGAPRGPACAVPPLAACALHTLTGRTAHLGSLRTALHCTALHCTALHALIPARPPPFLPTTRERGIVRSGMQQRCTCLPPTSSAPCG